MDARRLLTITALSLSLGAIASDSIVIEVQPGEFTIEQALQQARLARLHQEGDNPTLLLHAGTYRLSQPVVIRPEDSHTRIIAEEGTVLNGGVRITGWRREGKLWVADVPEWNGRPLEFRQMWVNGRKAIRARDVDGLRGVRRGRGWWWRR